MYVEDLGMFKYVFRGYRDVNIYVVKRALHRVLICLVIITLHMKIRGGCQNPCYDKLWLTRIKDIY